MIRLVSTQHNQKGFTIVELMIATAAFSLLLMGMLSAFVFLGRLYYKGITEANTQEVARNVLERTADVLRLSGSDLVIASPAANSQNRPGDWTGAFCIGNKKYSYLLDRQLVETVVDDTTQATRLLVESDDRNCTTTREDLVEPAGNPVELLEELMGLSEFTVTEMDDLVSVNATIVFGEDEQFNKNENGIAIGCNSNVAGSEFCAVAELNTVVFRKVN